MSTDDNTPSAPQFNNDDDAANLDRAQAAESVGQDEEARQNSTPDGAWAGEANAGPRTVEGQAHEVPRYGQPQSAQQSGPYGQPGPQPSASGSANASGYGQAGADAGSDQGGHAAQGVPHAQGGHSYQPDYGDQQGQPGQGGYSYAPGHGAQPGYGQQQGQSGHPGYGGQQYQAAPGATGPYQFSGMQPQDARLWATLTHIAAPALYLLSAGFIGFIAPLVMWLIFKDKDPLVRQAGAASFNFNFALMLISVGAWILTFISFGLLLPLTGLVLFAILVVQVIFAIFGAMAANRGESYKYPFEVPILK